MINVTDYNKAVEVRENLWWVGWPDYNAGFSNNPYLMVEEDVVILFDPGSALPEHWGIVRRKVESVVPLNRVTTVVVHHQDPDLCAAIPLLEQELGVDAFEIVTSDRTAVFIPYYNVRTEVTPVQDSEVMTIGENHELLFITTPYLHFPGAINSYDLKYRALFSSDIFGAFSVDWALYANENYRHAMKVFGEPYFASKAAVQNYVAKIKNLEIDLILPQHGSIINDDIPSYVQTLEEMEVGQWR